ncbi:uncharacterized protein LTR77_000427 [Saxophila tyrrhenica]|uniref:Glycine zipper domain-containing protein n=1 Tax=Saxophila tyrrhenica TaxID=1690608 RepID=A0AAV9PMZ9_9PEZI|nr:hypothetical protein LTR77_000427 [Saxophila tyrrhenica]
MAPKPEQPAPEAGKTQKQNAPDKENFQKSVAAAQKTVQAQGAAEALKQQAKKAINPKERMRLMQEAYHKEIEAHGQSKYAKRLQSGGWQGAAAGGGIGGGVAMGLGTVVGTVVSGVAAVPTVLVGGLVGAGVGGIHGPFIKLGGGGKKENTPATNEEVQKQEAAKLDQAVEKSASTVPQPPTADSADPQSGEQKIKKKPRKLEVRSKPTGNDSA